MRFSLTAIVIIACAWLASGCSTPQLYTDRPVPETEVLELHGLEFGAEYPVYGKSNEDTIKVLIYGDVIYPGWYVLPTDASLKKLISAPQTYGVSPGYLRCTRSFLLIRSTEDGQIGFTNRTHAFLHESNDDIVLQDDDVFWWKGGGA